MWKMGDRLHECLILDDNLRLWHDDLWRLGCVAGAVWVVVVLDVMVVWHGFAWWRWSHASMRMLAESGC